MSRETNGVRKVAFPTESLEPLSCAKTSIRLDMDPLNPTSFTGHDVTHHQPLCQINTRVLTGPRHNDLKCWRRPHRSFQLALPASEASVTGNLFFSYEKGLGWHHNLPPRWVKGEASNFVATDGTVLEDPRGPHYCYVQDRLVLDPGLASVLVDGVLEDTDLDERDLVAPGYGGVSINPALVPRLCSSQSEKGIDAKAFEKAKLEHEQELSQTAATRNVSFCCVPLILDPID